MRETDAAKHERLVYRLKSTPASSGKQHFIVVTPQVVPIGGEGR